MKTAIIIPSKNAALLAGCLGAIRMTTDEVLTGQVGIVVVANGTPEDLKDIDTLVRETRGQLPVEAKISMELMPPTDPSFYGNLCHRGARFGKAQGATELVFLNDDTYPTTGWLENLRIDLGQVLAAKHLPGLVGCRGSNVSGPQNIFSPVELAARQRYHRHNPELIMEPMPVPFFFPRVVTFACMVRTEDYFKVGGFDLDLPAHDYSDDILSYRFLKAGHRNIISKSFVAHLGSRTVAAAATLEEAQKKYEDDVAVGGKYLKEHYPDYEAVCLAEMERSGMMR